MLPVQVLTQFRHSLLAHSHLGLRENFGSSHDITLADEIQVDVEVF